jgi:hypothetical protein
MRLDVKVAAIFWLRVALTGVLMVADDGGPCLILVRIEDFLAGKFR